MEANRVHVIVHVWEPRNLTERNYGKSIGNTLGCTLIKFSSTSLLDDNEIYLKKLKFYHADVDISRGELNRYKYTARC